MTCLDVVSVTGEDADQDGAGHGRRAGCALTGHQIALDGLELRALAGGEVLVRERMGRVRGLPTGLEDRDCPDARATMGSHRPPGVLQPDR